jgi:hypothetical protein
MQSESEKQRPFFAVDIRGILQNAREWNTELLSLKTILKK